VSDAAVAAIEYALGGGMDAFDAREFLRMWSHGEFSDIRNYYARVPEEVFIGADPLHPETKLQSEPAEARGVPEAERLAADIDALYRWTGCLSYNDSYVGEPEGEFKRRIRSLSKMLDQVRAERSAAPAPAAEQEGKDNGNV